MSFDTFNPSSLFGPGSPPPLVSTPSIDTSNFQTGTLFETPNNSLPANPGFFDPNGGLVKGIQTAGAVAGAVGDAIRSFRGQSPTYAGYGRPGGSRLAGSLQGSEELQKLLSMFSGDQSMEAAAPAEPAQPPILNNLFAQELAEEMSEEDEETEEEE